LRINGKFEGSLTTRGSLTVGPAASVIADIVGEKIIVAGKVKGNIKATTSLILKASSHVDGDISAPRVSIEEGAVFNGRCRMSNGKLSLPELSDYLAIEPEKIREWVSSGKIPAQREGVELFFDRREVELWMKQNA